MIWNPWKKLKEQKEEIKELTNKVYKQKQELKELNNKIYKQKQELKNNKMKWS